MYEIEHIRFNLQNLLHLLSSLRGQQGPQVRSGQQSTELSIDTENVLNVLS
jgi:hypothetical protein